MKKEKLEVFQMVSLFALIIYIIIAMILTIVLRFLSISFISKLIIYLAAIPVAMLISFADFHLGFFVKKNIPARKYHQYYDELGKTNTLSDNSVSTLKSLFEIETDISAKNEIIMLLSTYYLPKQMVKDALFYLNQYDLEYYKLLNWTITGKREMAQYIVIYMGALLENEDLDEAKVVHDKWINLLDEFKDYSALGIFIRIALSEYHLNFLEATQALELVEQIPDTSDRSLKIAVAADKAMSYRILEQYNNEKLWLDKAYSYCENDNETSVVNKLSDVVNKLIQEHI